MPGTIGRWNRMSCSPCTASIAACGLQTRVTVARSVSQIGTTANTGGASAPSRCAGIGSFVAAAYARARSASTVNSCSSDHRPISSSAKAMSMAPSAPAVPGIRPRPAFVRTLSLLFAPLGPDVGARGRVRLEPFGRDRLAGHLVDPVGAVVDALERGLELRELGLERLQDREILLALEGLAAQVRGVLVVVGQLRHLVALGSGTELAAQVADQPFHARLLGLQPLTCLVGFHDRTLPLVAGPKTGPPRVTPLRAGARGRWLRRSTARAASRAARGRSSARARAAR